MANKALKLERREIRGLRNGSLTELNVFADEYRWSEKVKKYFLKGVQRLSSQKSFSQG